MGPRRKNTEVVERPQVMISRFARRLKSIAEGPNFKSWSSAADLLASFHSRNEDYDESFASIHTSGSSMDSLLRFGNPCPGSQTQHHLHHDR